MEELIRPLARESDIREPPDLELVGGVFAEPDGAGEPETVAPALPPAVESCETEVCSGGGGRMAALRFGGGPSSEGDEAGVTMVLMPPLQMLPKLRKTQDARASNEWDLIARTLMSCQRDRTRGHEQVAREPDSCGHALEPDRIGQWETSAKSSDGGAEGRDG